MKISEGVWRTVFVGVALIAVPLADALSAMFVPLTSGVRGLAELIGHAAIAAIYGGIIGTFFRRDSKALLVLLPASLMMAGLLRSVFFFWLNDRVFDFVDWWTYILSSKFGFNWLLVVPTVAFITARWVMAEPKPQATEEVEVPPHTD